MSNTKITDLSSLAATPAANDQFVLVDVSDTTQAGTGTTKRLDADYIALADGNLATITGGGTIALAGFTATVPATGTLVTTAATQTLTNKTLTTPTITILDNALTVQDNSDATKQMVLQLSGITTGTTRTLTVPDASTTLVGTDATQTLTNKTLTTPTIGSFANANHTHAASGATGGVVDHVNLSNIGTNSHATIDTHIAASTGHGATGAVVGTTNTQTLTNKTLTSPVLDTSISGTAFLDEDDMTSNSATKVASQQSIKAYVDSGTVTMTNKTLTSPTINTPTLTVNDNVLTIQDNVDTSKKLQFQVSGVTASTTRTLTVPDANTTIVGTDATQTLTNKTLTTPTIASFTNATHTHANAAGGGTLDHTTALTNVGTNTHSDIDTHIAATAAHGATGAVVGTTNSQTLTNKTLTTPTIASFANATHTHTNAAGGGQISHTTALTNVGTNTHDDIDTHIAATAAHGATGAVVGTTNSQTLTNKTLTSPTINTPTLTVLDNALTLQDNADNTKEAIFQLSGITTGTTRTVTLHNGSGTMVIDTGTQTLTNKTLTSPTINTPTITVLDNALTLQDNSDNTKQAVFELSGITTGVTRTVTLHNGSGTMVIDAGTQTLTNKTLTSPIINTPTITVLDNALTLQDNGDNTKQALFELSGITTGNTRTVTLHNGSGTMVLEAGTQTLTNKTLTTPAISSPTVSGTLSVQAGGSSGEEARVGGVMYVTTTQTGNVGTGEDTLATYTVPAATLATNNDSLWFEAAGTLASNTNSKTIRVNFGSTVVTSAATSSASNTTWVVRGRIFRTGAATQKANAHGLTVTTHLFFLTGLSPMTETLSGALALAVTGEATSNNDITLETFIVGFDPANS